MKIRCENCGASIDTEKETKCSKCGTFYDRNIFREQQTGIKNEKCNNPLHNDCDIDGYSRDTYFSNKRFEYKNGKKVEYYDFTSKSGNKKISITREYSNNNIPVNKNKNSGLKVIFIFLGIFFGLQFLIPIIMAVLALVTMFIGVSEEGGFEKIIEDQFVNNSINTEIITEVNNENEVLSNGPIHYEVRSLVDEQYFVGLDEYQEILDYKDANDDFRYYRFRFQVENLTDEKIYSKTFSAVSEGINCARIHREEDIFDEIEPYEMETRTRYFEDVIFEIPKENKDLEIIYNDNIKFNFYNFQY